ncbi:hypothetical protein Taro_051414 [Colocasia esculenta]|uniref:Uncharacterized protein n=1 Tax=Colocasia esculenta TaxID=4460 RepID=A0A843XFX4_COLES|nr:hypothetical protein [Colocasia esculenta]
MTLVSNPDNITHELPLSLAVTDAPLQRSECGAAGELVRSGGAASWSEEEVAVHRKGPSPELRIPLVCLSAGVATARRDIKGGVDPVGHDLITMQLAVAIRLSCRAFRSRRVSGSRQGSCCGASPGRDKAVAAPFPVTMVSLWARLCVGVCPKGRLCP